MRTWYVRLTHRSHRPTWRFGRDKLPIGFPGFIQRIGPDDPVIIASHLLHSVPRHIPLQVAKLVHRTPLHRHPRPDLLYGGSQSFVPIDDHQARPPKPSADKSLDKPSPLLRGAPLSKSAISRIVGRPQALFSSWRKRSLKAFPLMVLYLDAIALRVRVANKVVSLPVLVALGVSRGGQKEVLDLELLASESTLGWAICHLLALFVWS